MEFHPSLEFEARGDTVVLTDRNAASAGIAVAFTTRSGGVSRGPYDSLNLSIATGDDPALVGTNRARAAAAIGLPAAAVKFARQVHGATVVECDTNDDLGEADALIARTPGSGVGVLTADCVPVLVFAEEGVAAIHAGWRGIVAGVVDAALDRLGDPIAVWVGPSIHACCYEVGPDVTAAFEERDLPIADPSHVDPAAAVSTQLRRRGVDRMTVSPLCTSCDERFFSHRREGSLGRQGGLVALR